MSKVSFRDLIDRAVAACEHAYCPYSRYRVGAAILTFDDRVYIGCNVENASYTQTKHAEEVALVGAIADGLLSRASRAGITHDKMIVAIAIYAPDGKDPWPCCNCRQTLSEFGLSMQVVGHDSNHDGIACQPLSALIPYPFIPSILHTLSTNT